MEVDQVGWIAYGKNRVELGRLGGDGCIRHHGALVFCIKGRSVYSAHDGYLGRLQHSIASTERGELLFVLSRG